MGRLYVPTVEEQKRLAAYREAQRKYRAENPLPAPSGEVARVMAADQARQAGYDVDAVRAHDEAAAFDAEDTKQWDAEREALHDAGRIGGSEAFHNTNPEEENER